MAKKEEKKYKYPSRFGSHKSMINLEKTEALNDPNMVICTDEHGEYTTYANRLDNGLMDPIRANGDRVKIEKEKGRK